MAAGRMIFNKSRFLKFTNNIFGLGAAEPESHLR